MARHKSAVKQLRSSKRKHDHNATIKSRLKTLERKVKESLNARDIDKTTAYVKEAITALQRAAARNVIHKNTASRKISRLVKLIQKTTGTK